MCVLYLINIGERERENLYLNSILKIHPFRFAALHSLVSTIKNFERLPYEYNFVFSVFVFDRASLHAHELRSDLLSKGIARPFPLLFSFFFLTKRRGIG